MSLIVRKVTPSLNRWAVLHNGRALATFATRGEAERAALAVATHLESHPGVEWVNYPGLKSSKFYARAQKYMPTGQSALVTFGITGGYEAGKKLINAVKLFSHVANIGDSKSLIIHPASTTHSQLTVPEQADTGVTPDLVRLSVGTEDIRDILADLDQAIAAANA